MKVKQILLPTILACLLLASACSNQAPATATQVAPDEISVQLSWIHEYSVAPFHAAEKGGHFAEQNLKVNLVEGGFNDAGYIDPITEVLNGNVDFGIADATTLIIAQSEGKDVVGVASLMQRSPSAIISLKDKGIIRPEDLVGKTIAVNDDGARLSYNALIASKNIDPTSIKVVPRTSYGIDPLLNDEVDAIYAWIINEGVMVEEAGKEANFIMMSDYAVDTYNFVVFTTADKIKANPDLIQRFVNAIVAGTDDVVNNPEKAIEYTLSYNPELDKDAQLRRLNASIPLINVTGLSHGTMQASVWESTQQMLLDQGTLAESIDLNTVYDEQFVDKVHQAES